MAEFEEAQKIANGQTKVYGQVANILLAVVTALIPLFFNQDKEKAESADWIFKKKSLIFSVVIFLLEAYFLDILLNKRGK